MRYGSARRHLLSQLPRQRHRAVRHEPDQQLQGLTPYPPRGITNRFIVLNHFIIPPPPPQDIEALLPKPFWRVENGYCLPLDSSSMPELSQLLAHSEELSASVSRALRVGVQWDTQVGSSDMANASQRVCQVFCSALPVSYCRVTRNLDDWERFATMVLTSA